MVRSKAKVTIDTLQEVVHEKSTGAKMNDLGFCLKVVSRSSTITLHSTLNI